MTDQSLIRTGIIRTGISRTGIMGPTLQPGPGVPGWNGLGQALAVLFPSAIWINFKHKCSIIITPDRLSVWNTSRPLFQVAGDVHVHWNANCSAWPTPHTQPRRPSVKNTWSWARSWIFCCCKYCCHVLWLNETLFAEDFIGCPKTGKSWEWVMSLGTWSKSGHLRQVDIQRGSGTVQLSFKASGLTERFWNCAVVI